MLRNITRIISALVIVIAFASCTKSPEDKAQAAIKEYITKDLGAAKSMYESVSFGKLDSTTSSYSESKEYKTLQDSIEFYQTKSTDCATQYTQALINEPDFKASQAKRDSLDVLKAKYDAMAKTVEDKQIDGFKTYKGEFNGYKMEHTYSANILGASVKVKRTFYLDKDLKVTGADEGKLDLGK